MDSLQEENAPEAAAGAADATAGSPAETPVASSPAEAAATDGAPPRVNKRKVAMYLAYLGHGYQGMQRNPGARTIEEDLFNAIHQAGGMKDCNADERGFQKVRGVSLSFIQIHNPKVCAPVKCTTPPLASYMPMCMLLVLNSYPSATGACCRFTGRAPLAPTRASAPWVRLFP